jgi:cellulose synthase/poly-beta-1,6-N-acetylglucosamine synthase-like glycosyltransferase
VGFGALNALNAAFRVAVLTRALRPMRDPAPESRDGAVSLADHRPPPRITLLVPLLREPESVQSLFEALRALEWPAELLDVKLILEHDDHVTRRAIDALGAPPFAQVLTVPPGGPRTKPRALNYALDFAEGEIVGVYDAEDRPDPGQLRRVADILRESPPEVACVQCRLDYYNARDGWLTRCFTVEYAIWFDVLLAGFRDLRLPIPLGGTSVFFRRAALERLGGWDAHNVTEDADLGIRLARAGMRCEISASVTREEAACRPLQWLRQRSRWLKGYLTTWLVHMRRPHLLLRDLGLRGFVAFQAIFLGGAAAYLGLPLLWITWAMVALGRPPAWLAVLPPGALEALTAVQILGWGAMLVAGFAATARRGETWLWPWIPTMAVYWPMGAAAAWLAVVELIAAPSFWRKTPHGLSRADAPAEPARA